MDNPTTVANRLDAEDLRCAICGNLDISTPLEYGHSLVSILQQASHGCKTCSLLCNAVMALCEEVALDEVKVGWDTNRIQGLRIVVGAISSNVFLHGIDMFTTYGK